MGSDKTRVICKEYADKNPMISLPERERNLGVTMNWIECIKQARGKYIMTIGGDDFWHNTDKIQIQVDYMEQHPECVLCHTDYNTLYEKTGKLVKSTNLVNRVIPPVGMIQKEVISGKEHISAGTMCIRKDMILKHIPFDIYEKEHFPCEDWPTIAILSAFGEIHYLPISTHTYRTGQESILNKRNYDSIRSYWAQSNNMARVIHNLFPKELEPYKDEPYFSCYVNHALLIAAYENNDFKSAHLFAKNDPQMGIAANMAKNAFSFQIYRFWRYFKHFL